MSITRHVYAILGLATILTTLSFSSAHLKGAVTKNQPQSVLVVNSTGAPANVTGSVTVTSIPAVQIASGQTLGVSTLPAVQLATGATVSVNNTASNPLPVQNVTKITPDYFTANVTAGAGSNLIVSDLGTIQDKPFVVTDISVVGECYSTDDVIQVALTATEPGNTNIGVPVTNQEADASGINHFTATLSGTHLVFPPGDDIGMRVLRVDGFSGTDYTIDVFGHYEN